MAMTALKLGAPEDYMQLLQVHADAVNLPRIGVDENVAFPAVQANIAPAVKWEDALGMNFQLTPFYVYISLYVTFREGTGGINGFLRTDCWSYR